MIECDTDDRPDAAERAHQGLTDWQRVKVYRTGKSPLSFSGRIAAEKRWSTVDGLSASITVWEVRTGGFRVAYDTVMPDRRINHGYSAASASEVMDHLEDVSAHLDRHDAAPVKLSDINVASAKALIEEALAKGTHAIDFAAAVAEVLQKMDEFFDV